MFLIAVFAFSCLSARAGLTIDAFSFPDDSAAAKAWTAQGDSPPVSVSGEGTSFPCPFDREIDRVYWDHAAKLDLSGQTGFEIDLSCSRPDALRSLSIYFRSGDGWYIWNKSIGDPGRKRLLLSKDQFSVEGKPTGWQAIDRIRISPWKGSSLGTRVVIYSMTARRDGLYIVKGTLSAAEPAEKSTAERAAGRVGAWLDNVGVPHATIDEKDVTRGALGGAAMAILPYNPNPPASVISSLRKFVKGGGKLLVFYSASPELASLMNVMLGDYTSANEPGRWSSIVFENPSAWRVPVRVYQTSWNIRPVFPREGQSTTIARWANAEGRTLKDPAWVAGDAGAWMTHILLEDDTHNKQRMLVGVIGHYMPSAWRDAARHALDGAGSIDEFDSISKSIAGITAMAAGAQDEERVREVLDRAAGLHTRMQGEFRQGNYASVLETERALHAALAEAYSLAQRPKPGEFRAVWDKSGTGWFPGDWNKTCKILAGSGITAIFPQMVSGGSAQFPNGQVPLADRAKRYGDQVEQCVAAAHKNGLKVHIWKVCWSLDNAPDDFIARMKKEGRLQMKADGKTAPWLDPAVRANVEMEIATLKELVTHYAVDGVHLDYVRYPSSDLSFSPASRKAFERWLGRETKNWPADVQPGGNLDGDYKRWRAATISKFVREAHDALKAIRPDLKFSAAVWGNYPDCMKSVGQDWASWLDAGIVDFVCPMNYTVDRTRFSALVRNQLALPRAAGRVYPGIGVTAAESQLEPDQVIEQVRALRKLGANGFVLYDLSHTLLDETLPALKAGATSAR